MDEKGKRGEDVEPDEGVEVGAAEGNVARDTHEGFGHEEEAGGLQKGGAVDDSGRGARWMPAGEVESECSVGDEEPPCNFR